MPLTILVTGFGAFPGVRHNPSAALMAALDRRKASFASLGIRLETRILPVIYADIAPRLANLVAEVKPDAILHFGLAPRRRRISIETRAVNRLASLALDATGAPAGRFTLVQAGAFALATRLPARQILASLTRSGIKSALSRDAGTYLCNATLYHSLAARPLAFVGFIHIPWPARIGEGERQGRPTFAQILKAAEIAILETARAAWREAIQE